MSISIFSPNLEVILLSFGLNLGMESYIVFHTQDIKYKLKYIRATRYFLLITVWAETGDFRDAHSGMSGNGNMDHPQLPFPASARSRTRERKGKYENILYVKI